MTENEAKQFMIAWQNYLRHFSIAATQRTVDLVTACGVTLFLYVPRGVALAERRRNGPVRGPREAPQGPAQVFRFYPPGQPQGAATEPETIPGMAEAEPVH
jgi:hypothetical protein